MAPLRSHEEWQTFLGTHPEAHLLQTSPWGTLKDTYGWEVERLITSHGGAQILFRRLPLGYSLAYVPKGPLGDWLPALLPELVSHCRARRAFVLKIEPDHVWDAQLADELRRHHFKPSPQNVQPARTLIIDLAGDEDEILARMHQKTRYNIRLAARKGVQVRPWSDLEGFGRMVNETAQRDRFGAHVPGYYRLAYDLFKASGECEILVAEYEQKALAAVMVFARGARAWYLYGASTSAHRNRMPTYLLQWEAIRWALARSCKQYDLWGIPDEDQATLESEFMNRSDGLWGVYRFKRGFGGTLTRHMGAWDLTLIPALASLYYKFVNLRGV